MSSPANEPHGRGFTLLEVLVAVAILSFSLTSLLTSQMNALRATRYSQAITAIAFLAESKLIDIEWELKQDGWPKGDQDFEDDFSEEGWPDVTYKCLVDMIEMPEYSQIQQAVDSADDAGLGEDGTTVQDTGEQAFGMLGLVWPIVKNAIENSIRRASCTVFWSDGTIQHDFTVATFWTDLSGLTALPAGETGEEDEDFDDPGAGGAGGGPGGAGGGRGGPGGGGSAAGGGRGGIGGGQGGPTLPPSMRGGRR